jgi:putative ABC transport system permease protein
MGRADHSWRQQSGRFRGARSLTLTEGIGLADLFDTGLGADLARDLCDTAGDPISVSHGPTS